MTFSVSGSLSYNVSGPSTVLCSLSCIRTNGQVILSESLTTNREVAMDDLSVGLDANRFVKLDVQESGELIVQYEAKVETSVCFSALNSIRDNLGPNFDAHSLPYLFPSRYAQSDRLRAVSNDMFGGIQGDYARVLAIEDWIHHHISYQAGSSNEQSSALNTLESRSGVCRDFAHLGIALCRAMTIPARYITAYAYQLEPQDFHAAFEAYIDGTWYVFDATRLAPLNGLVKIAAGRDASDAAVATLFGNISGQGMQVNVQLDGDSPDNFVPVTRNSLQNEGQVLFLV